MDIKQIYKYTAPFCYKADNYFAYLYDICENKDDPDKYLLSFSKTSNFAPTYDKWCLYCMKKYGVTKKCSNCKSVFYCSRECSVKAWKIHKNHCGRDLFTICINCGNSNTSLKCPDCPVKFCSQKCKDVIYNPHKDYDCDYFAKTFNK